MRHLLGSVLALVLSAGTTGLTWAAEPVADITPEKVKKSIDAGVKFLRDQEGGKGHWNDAGLPHTYQGGYTSLALLALLHSGVPPTDAIIQRGLGTLRGIPPTKTYVVGLQTMVFTLVGDPQDSERIQRNVDWLVKTRVMKGGTLKGWSYDAQKAEQGTPDNSNSQYALLGLHEGHVAGAKIDESIWQSIRTFYTDTQQPGGWWGYPHGATPHWQLTMTTAGLCGLIISGMDLNATQEKILPDGKVENCGLYKDDRNVNKALDWLGEHFPPATQMHSVANVYYWLYGIERAGRLTGQRFIGKHDWYREGCKFLVGRQRPNGAWEGGPQDGLPVIATSFSLLFLSKGRTPILINKLAHGPAEDWNNDRNDARNLTEYASRELFKKKPLNWQVFDVRRAATERKEDLLADLLQSPIIYFNGHASPHFTGVEVDWETGRNGEKVPPLLRQYVEQGGFIFAEACCGRPEFDQGFRELMKQLFPDIKGGTDDPDSPLKRLPPEHPVWRAAGLPPIPVEQLKRWPLYGIEMGCKTVVVYSPNDLSCFWELNQHKEGRGQYAFRLGANVIAYATGMEPPKVRQFEIKGERDNPDVKVPRGYLKVAQLKHEGDWQPAPRAMRNLMAAMEKLGFDVDKQTLAIYPNSKSVNYKFLYMHGRNEFSYSDTELKHLKFNLENGGILFADACCGSKTFDRSFRDMISRMFPDKKFELIPLTDELFSQELNGTAITKVRCRREGRDGLPEPEFRDVDPSLEGIKINGRWGVVYSRYDIGCALEKHKSTDCLGHDPDSALRLGTAVVLYALKR